MNAVKTAASQTEGMGGDALRRIAAMARGYELMQRAIWNMAGTSGADASWYRNTALGITGRVDPLWKVEKFSNCSRPGDCLTQANKFVAALTPPETAEAVPASWHADDIAVDRFAVAMKATLAKAREKGKGGWYDETACSRQYLSDELRRHALKPDPVDVANYAMFLHQRGETIAPATDDRERLVEALREARQWVEANTAQVRGLSLEAAAPGEAMLRKIDAALATETSR